ncbi:MAG: APC family permease [Thermoplasmataceae archaeon]
MGSLRKNSLSFLETSFQGIAGSAPAGAAVATLTGAAAFALGALPLAAVLGFGVVMLNAVIIRRISFKTAGAGGYYSYIQKGLGTRTAGFSGIYYVFYQAMALCFMGLSTSVFVPALLAEAFGINIPSLMFYPIILGTLGFGFIMSYAGIRLSARFSLIMAAAEIAAITVIGAVILISHPSLNTPAVFTLSDDSNGITGLLLGVLLMYTAFSGFGASTPLGEEARSPKRTIGNSVIVTVLVLGAFFIFSSYLFTVAFGPLNMLTYSRGLVPGVLIIKSMIGPAAALLVSVLFINSLLTGAVIVTNSTSRVMMAMGRDGIINRRFAITSEKHKTPYFSAMFVVVIAAAVGISSNLIMGGFNAFLFAATAATLGVLMVHAVISASLPGMERAERDGVRISSVVMSVAAIGIFGFIFYSTFLSISYGVIAGTVLFAAFTVVNLINSLMRKKNYSSQATSNMIEQEA